MNSAQNNPASNQIGQGLTDAQVLTAVERSGYPLQTIIGEILRPNFQVQEEWSYLDKDADTLRSVDIRADQALHGWGPQPRVRPQISLLIECKQSQLPYIFFPSPGQVRLPNFPAVAGLRRDTIAIRTDDDASTWTLGVIRALGLADDPFQREPPFCSTFSKCVRKGPDLELSGSEAYSGLILPLIKAAQHFERAEHPVDTAWYFDAHLTVALGVLDAPMIAAASADGALTLTLLPWVRVMRHEYLEEPDRWNRNRLWAVEIVHKSFLAKYLTDHLLPFAHRFSERTLRHTTELATGEGFASGMGADFGGDNLEDRLRARPVASSITRAGLIAKNLIRLLRIKRRD